MPSTVGTLAGPTPLPTIPATAPPSAAPALERPIEVLTAPRSAVADVHRADAAYARSAAGTTGGDIPAVAVAAYMRAATVINAADKSCHLDWELLAAIGRVESNHGRFAGSTLNDEGVATPPILGLRLDGTHGTTRITDTDAGEYDGDKRFDRAVGPMQFIPSTWSYVGVDADGDGKRDPQDIQDASLGAAVYLCVGKGDLSTVAGQRAAVYRYNHSQRYVDLVLSIARGYASGSLWSVPGSASPTTTISSVTDPGTTTGGHTPPPQAEPVLVQLTQVVVMEPLPPLPEPPADVPPPPGHVPGPTDP
ncbi:MAG: lytic transglycosylase domain-containing protein, partial [Nocardioidaceae bacterium]|nr:lytic transglycosylase domain-containing protein [Nocardioidaceae bacterium]